MSHVTPVQLQGMPTVALDQPKNFRAWARSQKFEKLRLQASSRLATVMLPPACMDAHESKYSKQSQLQGVRRGAGCCTACGNEVQPSIQTTK